MFSFCLLCSLALLTLAPLLTLFPYTTLFRSPLLERFLPHLFQRRLRRGIGDDLRRLATCRGDYRRLHPLQRLDYIPQQNRVEVELTNLRCPLRAVAGLPRYRLFSELTIVQNRLVEPRCRRKFINQL